MADEKLNMTIYLLRAGKLAEFEKALVEGKAVFSLLPPLNGYFLPFESSSGEPLWVKVIRSSVEGTASFTLNSQSPAGLLVVKRDERDFVLSFGHAWQKLEDSWLEPHFGKRIALNAIPSDKLLEIRTEQVFAKWHLANERAPRASAVAEFGVEFDRDLVAAIEGTPSEKLLGATLRGATSVRIAVPFAQLNDILDKALSLFTSNKYKKTWPEIDNITPVKDEEIIRHLDDLLDADFNSGTAQKRLVLFTPSNKRDELSIADSFILGRISKTPVTRPFLTVDAWLDVLKSKGIKPSVKEAKGSKVHVLDEAKAETQLCSIYECFCYEVGVGGGQYLLSSGIWYEVTVDFLSKINRDVSLIAKPKVTLPKWKGEIEADYNLACSAADKNLLFFDAKAIAYGGGRSKFEFCDLLHLKGRTLFFVKAAHKSSGMSHLVEQGRRTAELFFNTDDGFRTELRKVFKKFHPTVNTDFLSTRPRHGDWQLCFVSLGRTSKDLPFFAKNGLAKVHKQLRQNGHDVSFLAV